MKRERNTPILAKLGTVVGFYGKSDFYYYTYMYCRLLTMTRHRCYLTDPSELAKLSREWRTICEADIREPWTTKTNATLNETGLWVINWKGRLPGSSPNAIIHMQDNGIKLTTNQSVAE